VWPDNESDVDLLGFDALVDELVVALTEPRLLPLTVGVLGDWGSGKSSLLRIARRELEDPSSSTVSQYVCVSFSPWQHEDYDDVKVALMRAVLDACGKRVAGDRLAAEEVSRLRRYADAMTRRGRWFGRKAVMVAPAVAPAIMGIADPHLAASTVAAGAGIAQAAAGMISEALQEDHDQLADDGDVTDISEFRDRFAAMVGSLAGVSAVVVFIDDLDRCLPDTVVDTFEAIRLFLNADHTAFVVAANREIVEAAIDARYPELTRQGRRIGADYLEKMLQLKVNVPPLSADETADYVNLLLTERRLAGDDFAEVCRALRARRAGDMFAPGFNSGIATDMLGAKLTPELAADLQWAAEISPALGQGLRGNPRQVKRFLNGLLWRQQAARRRGITLDPAVLAKLMVLDEQSVEDFQRLFDWQMGAEGAIPELARAEDTASDASRSAQKASSKRAAAPSVSEPGARARKASPSASTAPAATADSAVQAWATLPRVASWLQLDPALGRMNLRPYFTYFRDRLVVGSAASKSPPEVQALLPKLLSGLPALAREAIDGAKDLRAESQQALAASLLETMAARPAGPALEAAAELAGKIPVLAPAVIDAIRRLPHTAIPPGKVVPVVQRLPEGPDRDDLVAVWAASGVTGLAKMAEIAGRARARPSR
jgi:hypothetical protein